MPEFIQCSNCKTQNSSLVIKCAKCGSFLQQRVANLDLSDTILGVFEKPKITFKKICLSEQKNYVYLLSAFFGIGFLFYSFRYLNLTNYYSDLFNILLYGVFGGPFVGAILVLIYSILSYYIFKLIIRQKIKFKNILSVSAYSLSPMVIAVLFILPTEIIMFGPYLFSNNPGPQMLKPIAFYVLSFLNFIFILYSFILITIGNMIANNTTFIKSLLLSILSTGITIIILYFGLEFIKKLL